MIPRSASTSTWLTWQDLIFFPLISSQSFRHWTADRRELNWWQNSHLSFININRIFHQNHIYIYIYIYDDIFVYNYLCHTKDKRCFIYMINNFLYVNWRFCRGNAVIDCHTFRGGAINEGTAISSVTRVFSCKLHVRFSYMIHHWKDLFLADTLMYHTNK